MKIVQPIRDTDQIDMMKDYLKDWNPRNFLLLLFGLNTGLRVGDILPLKVKHVTASNHIDIIEQKTGKQKQFPINKTLRREIDKYIKDKELKTWDYLFESRKKCTEPGKEGQKQPISREQAWKILNQAAKQFGIHHIGTHSMRKSFGYHMYQKTQDIAMLMEMFNHSSPDITLRYIGINQERIDDAVADFSL
ncbi:TPA: site-specific integrase [Streptococcus equi subsp. zooepidemicus]|nr:site-specific integrase [Streptococcus equi subsp. zooepidemicus]HEL0075308.1 site-specific integrase [Streptococcus equi subsp. zooepidemicus]HEL0089341.1 site-specific integrase [Streptococcus equi subsp. zooepidemicus]HEL0447823.1 site-specific integrase [Streptococcus equi subsp. zooepidemicus]HEL0506374.1 site-specific integrase [Streptococcus equi subsp. zooepidemicus]